jgi:hypothetical protein
MLRPTSRAGRIVAIDLLGHPDGPIKVRQVAHRTGLALASVNDILRFFRFHGGITHDAPHQVRWNRLAELTSQLRLGDILPVRTVRSPQSLEQISSSLNDQAIPHVVAFTTAANRWAHFEPDPTTHIIVEQHQASKTAKAIESDQNEGGSPVLLYEDRLEALQQETLQGIPLTSRLQTWIDLHVFPHASAHAAFFKQVIENMHPQVRKR